MSKAKVIGRILKNTQSDVEVVDEQHANAIEDFAPYFESPIDLHRLAYEELIAASERQKAAGLKGGRPDGSGYVEAMVRTAIKELGIGASVGDVQRHLELQGKSASKGAVSKALKKINDAVLGA